MASAPNVSHFSDAEDQTLYREAVAQIIQQIKAEHSRSGNVYTDIDIAESIGVTKNTIWNAGSKSYSLSQMYLMRLARRYGPHILDPFLSISGGRAIPIEADEAADALPPVSAVVHQLTLVRNPGRPAHTELLDMEPLIDAAVKALTALKVRAQNLRSAA